MKIKILVSMLFSLSVLAVSAQENDDLYFNSKDRAKLAAQQALLTKDIAPAESRATDEETYESETSNPTDSYSSRDINPEFAARSNATVASEDDANYFVNDYKYGNQNKFKNFNDNYSSWNNSNWYSSNYYGPQINRWNSPYYGYYNSYNSPWADPNWSNYSGWSASFSYSWGNNYGYWNNPYCYNPYSYYNYNPYNSYGWDPYGYSSGYNSWNSYYYGYNSYYPRTIVVVNNGERGYGPRYGKRNSRSAESLRTNSNGGQPSRSNSRYTTYNAGGNSRSDTYSGTSGRQRTTTTSGNNNTSSTGNQGEYYRRSWRRVDNTANTNDSNGSSNSGTTTSTPSRVRTYSSDNTNSSSTPSRSTSSPSYSPSQNSSRSSSGSTYTPSSGGSSSGGSRSSGSSSSGSSGGGGGSRGRGRGN